MYKVFIKDKLLYLTSEPDFIKSLQKNTLFLKYTSSVDFKLGIELLSKDVALRTLVVFHKDINFLLQELYSSFNVVHAAGGVVENKNKEILMIFRMGKWDLPKGKIEKNENPSETAIREVQEETGISNLEIIQNLPDSFYFYEDKSGKIILKHIYWYKMFTNYTSLPVPQKEEGILKAEWKNRTNLELALENSFYSVNELLKTILF